MKTLVAIFVCTFVYACGSKVEAPVSSSTATSTGVSDPVTGSDTSTSTGK